MQQKEGQSAPEMKGERETRLVVGKAQTGTVMKAFKRQSERSALYFKCSSAL